MRLIFQDKSMTTYCGILMLFKHLHGKRYPILTLCHSVLTMTLLLESNPSRHYHRTKGSIALFSALWVLGFNSTATRDYMINSRKQHP